LNTDQLVAIKCIKRKALKGKEEALHNEISVLKKYVYLYFQNLLFLVILIS